jgi:hypothetical protein
MLKEKKAELVFCNVCDKVTYTSAVNYHYENPCQVYLMGADCMEFEAEEQFCNCTKVGA